MKQKLIQSVNEDRISHAQLFLGPEGNGALQLALAFAQHLNCENPTENDSCGVCNQCNKISKLIHPDLHFCLPVIGKKPNTPPVTDDYIQEWRQIYNEQQWFSQNHWLSFIGGEKKNGNITARECNEVIRKLNFKNFEGKYKVMIVWGAELLSKEGNKLLKIIEEPPANTLFILIANDLERILMTIQSRTQTLKIPRFTDENIVAFLTDKEGCDEGRARQLAGLAEGNLVEAIQMTREEENNFSELMLQWFEACFKKEVGPANKVISSLHESGRSIQKQFIYYILQYLREIMVYGYSERSLNRVSERELKLAAYMQKRCGWEDFEQLIALYEKGYYYITRNAHAKIQFFNFFIQSSNIFKQIKKKQVS